MPLPLTKLLARAFQNPQTQGNDQAGIFGQRNEVGRINKPSFRMLPTNQCFKAGELSVIERYDRLIVNPQLFTIDCPAQVVLHLQQVDRVRVHSLIEYFVTGFALGLGVSG